LLGFRVFGERVASADDGFFRALRAKPVVAGLRRSADTDKAVRSGLNRTCVQVEGILSAGAIAISTGAEALWGFRGVTEQENT
jgi:hypothetical protein